MVRPTNPSAGSKLIAPFSATEKVPSPGTTRRVPCASSSSVRLVAASDLIRTVSGTSGWEALPAVSLPSTSMESGVPTEVRPSSSRSVAITGAIVARRVARAELSACTPSAISPIGVAVPRKSGSGTRVTVRASRSIVQVPSPGTVTSVSSGLVRAPCGRVAASKRRESERTSRTPRVRSMVTGSPGAAACSRSTRIG